MALTISPPVSLPRRGRDVQPSVVWVRGEQDIATGPALLSDFLSVTTQGTADVLVDMSEVTFMDASTVGAVVRARNLLVSCARSLEVRSPSPPAQRVLDLCGLGSLVQTQSR